MKGKTVSNNKPIFAMAAIFLGIIVYYHTYAIDYGDIWLIKYISVAYIVSAIIAAFVYLFFVLSAARLLLLTIAIYPFIVWGESVIIVEAFDIYVPLSFLVYSFVFLRGFAEVLCFGKEGISKLESYAWFFLILLNLSRFISFFSSPILHWEVFVTDILCPTVFVLVLLLFRLRLPWLEWKESLLKGLKYLIVVVVSIMILEMVARSGGHPEKFLLHGARRYFAGTSGDVTGGMGEPVTLGLWAILFAYSLYVNLELSAKYHIFVQPWLRKAIVVMIGIAIFTVSRSALIIAIALVIGILHKSRGFTKKSKSVMLLMGLLLSLAFIPVYLAKSSIGSNATNAPTRSVEIGDYSISTELNMAIYISRVTTWLDPNIKTVPWYMQAAMIPLIGGVNGLNIVKDSGLIFGFLRGLLINIIFLVIALRLKKYGVSLFPIIPIFLVYWYYGFFGSTAHAFFYEIGKPISLGYVPREAPEYLFILWIVTMNTLLSFKKN